MSPGAFTAGIFDGTQLADVAAGWHFAPFSWAQGVKMASKYVPDLVVCDVMMPGMDGLNSTAM